MKITQLSRSAAFAAVLFGLSLPVVHAAPYAVVDTVQAPAWVERGGQRAPLVAGEVLKNRDRVITGEQARVVLRLAEGSAVKLGENAAMKVDALGKREGGVFTAALDVATGAFRFTTGIFSNALGRRAVNVRVASITAGIRGTDLWGSSDHERDLICLIEGRITAVHPDAEPVQMSDPMSFYVAPRGLPPMPIESVGRVQLALWALQTEVQMGVATFRADGRWKVLLATVDSEREALAYYDTVRAAGYPVRIKPRAAGQRGYRYELFVPQLASQEDAEALAVRLRQQLGLEALRASR